MAKKKYHQGMKDRMDESRGMRRKDERGAGFISEDHSCIANLPKEVKMQEYPRFMYGLDPYLDDTIRGIDGQIYSDDSQMKKHISKSKY